jgi:hypothetical protein
LSGLAKYAADCGQVGIAKREVYTKFWQTLGKFDKF